jgi:tRNA U34 2-thiouridine synthase MnmA/TrmU
MKYKAVGLLSGGLDSALACKLVLDQGFEVHVVYLEMPWGCGKSARMQRIAESFGLPFKIIPLADDYLQILRKPKHGFGSALNPCADCHAYMVRKAAEYMREIQAAFIFTGEVIGQRPMSQRRECLKWVEDEGGIPGRLLRPLSAQLLEPTIPEQEGIVDRSRLLGISGRSRKTQLELAKKYGLEHYSQPGGGCLLTEKIYGARLKDVLARGCNNIAETTILGLGRFFRISDRAYAIVARDDEENEKLIQHALDSDLILRSTEFPGPAAVLCTASPSAAEIAFVAGLVQYFSKMRREGPQVVSGWKKSAPARIFQVTAAVPDEEAVKRIWM